MTENLSIKGIIKNLLYSFMSYAMPTAILQFLIQPILAQDLGGEVNGQYLTIMAFHYFMTGITATVLNNVRLLRQKEYDAKGVKGDFNLFLLAYAILAVIVVPIAWVIITGQINFIDAALMIMISFLYLYHDYIFAEYRLKLQYNKILINNILMSVGYGLGLLAFKLVGRWQVVFIIAYVIPTVYDLFNTTFLREPMRTTSLFGGTAKNIGILTCSNMIGTLPSYCDKFILYPSLGGASISVYNSAAIVGKLLLLVSSPMNSVLLSYLVKLEKINKKAILKRLWIVALIALVGYVACVLVGYPLTAFLYPEWKELSMPLIPITVAASMFSLIAHMLNMVVLRFYKTSYQVMISGVSLIVYVVLSVAALLLGGLVYFCIAIACANAIKAAILLFIIFKSPIKEQAE